MHGINEGYDRESEVKTSIANAFTKSEIHKSISSIQVSLKVGKKKGKKVFGQIYSYYLSFQK